MKRIGCILLSVLTVLTAILSLSVGAGAMLAPKVYGDVDQNGTIEIFDATMIQRYLAKFDQLTKLQRHIGDMDDDGELTIFDATYIQRSIAGMMVPMRDYLYDWYIYDARLYADFDADKAVVGMPVTFHADAIGGMQPFTYEFYVDDEIVQPRSTENELVYTFTAAGEHTVVARLYTPLDTNTSMTMKMQVQEDIDLSRPNIVSAVFRQNSRMRAGDGPLTVRTIGGTAPYRYQYTLIGALNENKLPEYFHKEDEDDEPTLGDIYVSDLIEEDTLSVGPLLSMLNGYMMGPVCKIQIIAYDAEDIASEPVTVDYICYEVLA